MSSERAPHVIWQTPPGQYTEFELEYVTEVLLGGAAVAKTFDEARYAAAPDADDRALIVYSSDDRAPPDALLSYLGGLSDYSLLHLSNETLRHDAGYYGAARAVLRCYYDPLVQGENVYVVPLGFKSGFLSREETPPAADRPNVWCFFGQPKGHRWTMLEALRAVGPYHEHLTSGWMSKDGLTTEQMAELYRKTVFVPCPFGNLNPDSFRIMESLENGCIPVSLTFQGVDYFRYVYGDHPFVLARDWREAAEKIRDLSARPKEVDALQRRVAAWYRDFKAKLSDDVERLIAGGGRGDLASEQFRYQREGAKDLALRARFWLWFYAGGLSYRYRKFLLK